MVPFLSRLSRIMALYNERSFKAAVNRDLLIVTKDMPPSSLIALLMDVGEVDTFWPRLSKDLVKSAVRVTLMWSKFALVRTFSTTLLSLLNALILVVQGLVFMSQSWHQRGCAGLWVQEKSLVKACDLLPQTGQGRVVTIFKVTVVNTRLGNIQKNQTPF